MSPGGDVKISLALARFGWNTRFVRAAVADNLVVEHLADYWHQHLRWARNLYSSRRRGGDAGRLRLVLRLEERAVSAGYLDRLALAAVLPLGLLNGQPLWFAAAHLAIVAAEVVVAVAKAGALRRLPLFLLATAALSGLDVVASLAASIEHLFGHPRVWRQPRRA